MVKELDADVKEIQRKEREAQDLAEKQSRQAVPTSRQQFQEAVWYQDAYQHPSEASTRNSSGQPVCHAYQYQYLPGPTALRPT